LFDKFDAVLQAKDLYYNFTVLEITFTSTLGGLVKPTPCIRAVSAYIDTGTVSAFTLKSMPLFRRREPSLFDGGKE
jgi:hypothetical protein